MKSSDNILSISDKRLSRLAYKKCIKLIFVKHLSIFYNRNRVSGLLRLQMRRILNGINIKTDFLAVSARIVNYEKLLIFNFKYQFINNIYK